MPIRTWAMLVGSAATILVGALLVIGRPTERVPERAAQARLPDGYEAWGLAVRLDVPIFNTPQPGRKVIGRVQRGTQLPIRPARTTRTCSAHGNPGAWFQTPSGYLCTASGISLTAERAELDPAPIAVDASLPLPFDYVKVMRVDAGRYRSAVASKATLLEYQTKAYFLAVADRLKVNDERWIRTAYGEYVEAKETRPVVPTRFRGTELDEDTRLPLAWVVSDEPVVPRCRSSAECPALARYTRFEPEFRLGIAGTAYVVSRDGRMVPADVVRTASLIDRPDGIPDGARWVHIDLDQQTFVAYEDDVPHYASLLSSGKEGYDTPTGLFQTQRKYLTKMMRGPDDKAGRYRVEEIPWVMYYDGNYAVHAAYWHDEFGNVRSHGCSNLSPVDAQWLYHWDQSEMPEGWHAQLAAQNGLYFYLTRAEPDEDTAADEAT